MSANLLRAVKQEYVKDLSVLNMLYKLKDYNHTLIPMGKQSHNSELWYELFRNKGTSRVTVALLGRDLCFNKLLKAEWGSLETSFESSTGIHPYWWALMNTARARCHKYGQK